MITFLSLLLFSCKKKEKSGTTAEEVFRVKVEKPMYGNIENRVKYLGNIEADNEVLVYSLIPQKITSIRAEVNDIVEKGQVLATVKNVEVKQGLLQGEAGLSSAQANLDNVNTEWERNQRLWDERAISKSQYDASKAQKEASEARVKQAKATLKSTKEQFENSFIKSPIAGIVSARNFDIGAQTNTMEPVFTVVAMKKVKVKVNLVEHEIHTVKKGAKAYIEVKGISDKEFIGRVDKVHPTVDPKTRTVKAEIIIDNTNLELRPGMYAKVNIVTENAENVLLVPNYAIVEKTYRKLLGGEVSNSEIIVTKYCYVVKNDTVKQVFLKTGIEDSRNSQILEGITSNDSIVVLGQYTLSNGSKVKIVNE